MIKAEHLPIEEVSYTELVSVRVPKQIYQLLQQEAEQNKVDMPEMVRIALYFYLYPHLLNMGKASLRGLFQKVLSVETALEAAEEFDRIIQEFKKQETLTKEAAKVMRKLEKAQRNFTESLKETVAEIAEAVE